MMIQRIFLSAIAILVIGNVHSQTIHGRGATFPEALYEKMFDEYQNRTGIVVTYDGVGSGGGIRATLAQEIDFGASDRFLSDEQLASAKPTETGEPNVILHFPMAEAAVVPIYNFAPFNQIQDLVLDGETLAAIFLGDIRMWSDPRIKTLNPTLDLPNIPITIVHRAEASGTTSIFTDYLSKVSSDWARQIGQGGRSFLDWNVGIASSGNSGIVEAVQLTPGAIGYVVYSAAQQANLPIVDLINQAGNRVAPSLETVSNATDIPLPEDFRISLNNSPHPQGWPITGFTYLLVYQNQNYIQKEANGGERQRTIEEAQRSVELIYWMLTEGQEFNESLNYARLSESAQQQALELLESIYYLP